MVRPARPVPSCDIAQLLPVSARSPEALRALVRAYRDTFVAGAIDVSDACYTASVRRTHHAHRMTVVGRTPAELVAQLEASLAASPPTRNPGRRAPQQRRVALLTAGGGASAGRARPDVLAEPVVRSALARYDAAFAAEGIAGVSAMLAGGEPVCGARGAAVEFALGLALAALWRSWGVTPAAIVATGSDDLLALHLTGALGLEEAVHLVAHGRPALDRGAPGTRPMTVPMFIAGATEPCSVERTPAAPKAETTSQFAMASTLTALVASGVDVFLSLGGAAPVAAVAAIAASRPPLAVSGLAQDRLERATLLHALGRVYAAGVAIDWSGVHPVPRRCVVLPAYPWQRQRHWYEPGSTIGGAVTGDELGGGRVAGRHR